MEEKSGRKLLSSLHPTLDIGGPSFSIADVVVKDIVERHQHFNDNYKINGKACDFRGDHECNLK